MYTHEDCVEQSIIELGVVEDGKEDDDDGPEMDENDRELLTERTNLLRRSDVKITKASY